MPTKKTSTTGITKKVVAKKVPNKVSVAKSTKKSTQKSTSSADKKKPLVYADNQRSFWVTNGKVLNSLVALRDALEEMEKEVYLYHAKEAHNDFANWVSDVLADNACAVELSKAKNPMSAKSVVVKHLKFYAT